MSSSSSGITSLTRPSSSNGIDPVLEALMAHLVSLARWRRELVVRELPSAVAGPQRKRGVEIGNSAT